MARTESSGLRRDVKSGRSGAPPRHATAAGRGRGRGDPPRGESSPTLEHIVMIASRAASAAVLAAMSEIAPHEQRFNRIDPSIAARPRDGGGRRPGDEIEGEGSDEEFELDMDSAREDPLARLIETERGRMMLIDSLLGALGALFEEQHETHREASGPSRADPSLIVVLLRKMLGRVISRLDRIYVDPLIEQAAQGSQRRAASQRRRMPTSRRHSKPAQGTADRHSRQSTSPPRISRTEKEPRTASRAIRRRKEVRRPEGAFPRARR